MITNNIMTNQTESKEVKEHVYYGDEKFLDLRHSSLEAVSHSDKQAIITDKSHDKYTHDPDDQKADANWPRKRNLIIGVIVAIVIVAAIVGGVCGTLLRKKAEPASVSHGDISSAAPASSSATSSTTSSTSSSLPTSTPSASMLGPADFPDAYLVPSVVSWGYPHMEVVTSSSLLGDSQNVVRPLWLSRYSNSSGVNDWRTSRVDATYGPFVYISGDIHPITNSITAFSLPGNNTGVYAVGATNKALWTQSHNNAMTWKYGWRSIDGNTSSTWVGLSSAPGVGSCAPGRVSMFGLRGKTGEIWQKTYNTETGAWDVWQSLGGTSLLNAAPMVTSWANDRCDLFTVNQNKTLAYRYFTGNKWSPSLENNASIDLGGQLASRPFAIAPQVGQIDIFARGGDAGLWHLTMKDGTWKTWSRLGNTNTTIKGEPSAAILGNQMHVFAWSGTGALLYGSYDWQRGNSQDIQFRVIGTGLVGAPKAISDKVNIEVFAHLENDVLGWKVLKGGDQWSPSDQTMAGLWRTTKS